MQTSSFPTPSVSHGTKIQYIILYEMLVILARKNYAVKINNEMYAINTSKSVYTNLQNNYFKSYAVYEGREYCY